MSEIKLIDKRGMPYKYLGCVHNGGTLIYIIAYDYIGNIKKFLLDEVTVNIKEMRNI